MTIQQNSPNDVLDAIIFHTTLICGMTVVPVVPLDVPPVVKFGITKGCNEPEKKL